MFYSRTNQYPNSYLWVLPLKPGQHLDLALKQKPAFAASTVDLVAQHPATNDAAFGAERPHSPNRIDGVHGHAQCWRETSEKASPYTVASGAKACVTSVML